MAGPTRQRGSGSRDIGGKRAAANSRAMMSFLSRIPARALPRASRCSGVGGWRSGPSWRCGRPLPLLGWTMRSCERHASSWNIFARDRRRSDGGWHCRTGLRRFHQATIGSAVLTVLPEGSPASASASGLPFGDSRLRSRGTARALLLRRPPGRTRRTSGTEAGCVGRARSAGATARMNGESERPSAVVEATFAYCDPTASPVARPGQGPPPDGRQWLDLLSPPAPPPRADYCRHEMKSPQRTTSVCWPQGMIGTVEVEFCGEPSISLSE